MPEARVAPEIRSLPPLVVNQIAAGEVVERPASVVKELVDNAIDAGATRINVELEQGGIELVRVSDDGCGISAEQLPLAIAPHATSKIRETSDLDHIATMGFRGEALASIASVSRLSLRSRTAEQPGAVRLDVEGDVQAPTRPDAGPVGTAVTVRNLFFNTPARRKFLRSPTTEQGHGADMVRSLALAHPAIGFKLVCDGRTLLDLPPGQGPRERTLAIVGEEMEGQYLQASADQFDDARGVALWGLVGMPVLARPTTKWQHLFVNGRPIRDKTILHALKEAYRGLIEPGRHPAAVLMLEMDPGAVDVNVHPTKSEVRFRDPSTIHKVVYLAVREALSKADLTPSTAPERSSGWRFEPVTPVTPSTPTFAQTFERLPTTSPKFEYEGTRASSFPSTPSQREDVRWGAGPASPVEGRSLSQSPSQGEGEIALPTPIAAPRVLQVHNSFLITQDEQGVVIIDQHALHERVMFQKLSERLNAARAQGAALESQSLLAPVIASVPPARIELLDKLAPMLARLGVSATPMSDTAIGVQSFPTFLFERGVDPAEFITDLLERAEAEPETFALAGGSGEESALHEVLDMMACKAAVKAGDRLSEGELAELLHMRETVERSSNCPHGRPTAIRLTIRELERQFGRS